MGLEAAAGVYLCNCTDTFSYFSPEFPHCIFRKNGIDLWIKELSSDGALVFTDSVMTSISKMTPTWPLT